MSITMTSIWLIIIIVTIIFEVITLNLVSIWFSLGAFVAYLLSMFHFSIIVQIIAFSIVSLITILITRPLAQRYLRGNIIPTNADRIIGNQGLVTKEITNDQKGEIKVLGVYWTAVGVDKETIPVNSHVKVISIEGVKALVKRIEED